MIDPKLQNQIEEILAKYRGMTPIQIADSLGIEIVYPTVEDRDFSGAIKRVPNDGVVIFVNRSDSENRKLFTIAHELGHFFLHKSSVDNGIVSYRHAAFYEKYSEEQRKQEEQANHFAAEVLMPRHIFISFFRENSHLSLPKLTSKMASFFGVSEDAVRIRMSYLDLL